MDIDIEDIRDRIGLFNIYKFFKDKITLDEFIKYYNDGTLKKFILANASKETLKDLKEGINTTW